MTDPFSAATGFAGLVSLAGFVIGQCYRYGCGVADAPEEAKRLVSELTALGGILVGVQGLVKQSEQKGVRLDPVVNECKTILESLSAKLKKEGPTSGKSSGKRLLNRALWPLRKGDTEALIEALDRNKQTLSLALDSLSVNVLAEQGSILERISDAVSSVSLEIKEAKASREEQQVLDWLSEHQYDAQFKRGCQLHCADTCSWLLNDPAYLEWSRCRSSLLWMYGQAGSGKTIATSYLIQQVLRMVAPNGPLVAYFYYDASTIESLTPEMFFGTILKQFCAQLSDIPSDIVATWKRAASRFGSPKRPEISDLIRLTRNVMESSSEVVLVVDGLDESPDYGVVCDFLTEVVASGKIPVKVFISSRPENDIRRRLRGFNQLALPENSIERDIGIYIKRRISNDRRLSRMSNDMKAYVERALRMDCHGMFRWVQCQLDELSRLRTDGALKKALRQLPRSLEDSYSRILDKVPDDDAEYTRHALMWLAHASHPLTLPELADAVVKDTSFTDFDADNELNDPSDILEMCGSLVIYNPASRTARIAHHSVREYLTERLEHQSPFYIAPAPSHRSIAEICLRYLLMSDFSFCPASETEISVTLRTYPLLRYAALNWTFHVTMAVAEEELQPLILRLLSPVPTPNFFFWMQLVLYESVHGFVDPDELERTRPLYYAASYGMSHTVKSLIAAGAELNERAGRHGGTALHAAVWRNQPDIVKMLLDAGIDRKIKDYNGSTAEDLVIWTGNRRIAEILIDTSLDPMFAQLIDRVITTKELALKSQKKHHN